MRKIFITALALVVMLAISVSAAQAVSVNINSHNNRSVSVRLRGSQEVPAVSTETRGRFSYRPQLHNNQLRIMLSVFQAQDVTMAHLHCAAAGSNGPIVVTLMAEVQGGYDMNGQVLRTDIENDNIMAAGATCPTPITNVATLLNAINAGQIYVNVHTVAHPSGEIRAQLH